MKTIEIERMRITLEAVRKPKQGGKGSKKKKDMRGKNSKKKKRKLVRNNGVARMAWKSRSTGRGKGGKRV